VINEGRLEEVRRNGNKCLCTVEDTKCMCDEFIKNEEVGECHCGVYKKILMEE
jgi:hypothetical protein